MHLQVVNTCLLICQARQQLIQRLCAVCCQQPIQLALVQHFELNHQLAYFVQCEYFEGLVPEVFIQKVVSLPLFQRFVTENASF